MDSKSKDLSSILSRATKFDIMFKWNGKIWNPKNPEKKLKQLGITWDDVEIIEEPIKKREETEYDNTLLYKWRSKKDRSIISSIYDNLNNLKHIINIEDYEPII